MICAVLAVVTIIGLLYLSFPRTEYSPARGGVAIVDSFYSSTPNFTDEAVMFLSSKGVRVDVYRDENVTVELYRELPTYGYSLIILRVHAGLGEDSASPTFLFTNEPYVNDKYPVERASKQILQGVIDLNNPVNPVFSVGPLFVDRSMKGNFDNSTIILSSCYGLYNDWLADTFIERGAKAFIGWDGEVTLEHTDAASLALLKAFINQNLTVNDAVTKVMKEVGPDTACGSKLEYYPNEAGHATVNPISSG
jgi:hypothetical protein